MSSDEVALHEVFGDFDGIEGRAAEKLVSRDEHLKPLPVVAADVLADATGEDIVLRGRVERHRVAAVQRIVNNPHPLALREDLARLGGVLDAEGIEVRDYNEGELSLIFEQQYQKFSPDELKRELKSIMRRVMEERATEERKELEEEIRKAEEAGDDTKVGELMQKMSKLLRKK